MVLELQNLKTSRNISTAARRNKSKVLGPRCGGDSIKPVLLRSDRSSRSLMLVHRDNIHWKAVELTLLTSGLRASELEN